MAHLVCGRTGTFDPSYGNASISSTSNPCSISQSAAVKALGSSPEQGPSPWQAQWLSQQRQLFEQRRSTLAEALAPELSCDKPDGTFYLYPSCEALLGRMTPWGTPLKTDSDVAAYFLKAAKVSTVPDEAFGFSPYLRFSYALDIKRLKEAGARIQDAIRFLSESAA